ncbi:hypothetical protein [Endozoicomonas numazuensis]|nr:hypothetical protein [Endozoicomonas numazuensis]
MMFRIAVNEAHLGVVYRQSTPSFSVQQFWLQPTDIQKVTLLHFYHLGAPVPGLIVWANLAPYQEKYRGHLIDVNLGRIRQQRPESRGTNAFEYRQWLTSTIFDSQSLNRIMRYPAEVMTAPSFPPDLIELFTTMDVDYLPRFGRQRKLHDLSIYEHPIEIHFLNQYETRDGNDILHHLNWYSQVYFSASTRPGAYLLNGQTIYRNGQVELIKYQFQHGQVITYRRATLRRELEQTSTVSVKKNTTIKSPSHTGQRAQKGQQNYDSGLGTLTSTGSLTNAGTSLSSYLYLQPAGLEKLILNFR